jgi:nucleoside-diphosphate-sugar epimerase
VAKVIRGDLENLDALKEGAKDSDGVIHLAFINDFSSPDAFQKSTAIDRAAITAMSDVMAGSEKPLIICSGTLSYPTGEFATEDTKPRVLPGFDRDLATDLIVSLSKDKNIRGMCMRLAPTVHGAGDQGFVTMFGGLAQKNGFAAYVGDGSARWTAVHRNDAAVAFRLAAEKGKAGATYLPIAEAGVPMKDIQTAIGKKLNLPIVSKTAEELAPTHGFFGHLMDSDTPVNNEKTKKELGWEATKGPGLLEDIEKNYFN